MPRSKKLVSSVLTLRSSRADESIAQNYCTRKGDERYELSVWRRLHIYWRTLPQYNQFWKAQSILSSGTTPSLQFSLSGTPTQNRLRPRPGNRENDLIYVSPRELFGGDENGSSVSRSSRRASFDYSYRDRLDTARPGPSTDRRAFTFVASFSFH